MTTEDLSHAFLTPAELTLGDTAPVTAQLPQCTACHLSQDLKPRASIILFTEPHRPFRLFSLRYICQILSLWHLGSIDNTNRMVCSANSERTPSDHQGEFSPEVGHSSVRLGRRKEGESQWFPTVL
ncbi:hypothetical protein I79_024548 [Cricetulus griseus]|uniref:Uncharacterized protein n=1 Tax=Cricetulus griseus TaxID=10029 RepID=G3IKZ0_CRIGR|nr:hypothetical protein I79_024548 [Cricetulus griseus]